MEPSIEPSRPAARTATVERGSSPGAGSGRVHRLARSTVVLVLMSAWLTGTAAASTALLSVDTPGWVAGWGGGLVGVVHTAVVAQRVGARTSLWIALAVAAAVGAQLSDRPWVLAGVSVLTAVISGLAAVLLTRPAVTVLGTVVEYVLALSVAAAGAAAVAGLNATVDTRRYTLLVVGLSIALAITLVWRLGVGLHGLGGRGLALSVGAALLVMGLLVYSQLLREYGSASVVEGVDQAVAWLSDNLRAVPRPVEALIGLPALVWGIGTRSRRPQGWWLCAFGVLGTSMLAATLATKELDPEVTALSALYSISVGLLLGLLARGVDLALDRRRGETGSGRRVLRTGEVSVLRPEPSRTRPLR